MIKQLQSRQSNSLAGDGRQPGNHAPGKTPFFPSNSFLHRALGNRQDSRSGQVIQAKLRIGDADDEYEREADRVADRVMRMPMLSPPPDDINNTVAGIQRKCAACERDDEEVLRRKPVAGNAVPDAAAAVAGLNAGRPLDTATRGFFEPRFGHSFAQVRVHDDGAADQSARALSARAYTLGQHISFAHGEFRPDTAAGKTLLAHELTHTLQQRGTVAAVQRACDPALLAGRTAPVYFPLEARIVDVYGGVGTLTASATRRAAVGLIQQALVDLGYGIGASGPNGDGVDRQFGTSTAAGVTAFQTAEGIAAATAGVVDAPTLKCLDEKRSRLAVQPHQAGTMVASDVQIGGRDSGGRDEDIFFARGASTLSLAGRAKIGRLLTRAANPLKGCAVTLEGFISEDELVDFGSGLATDRINAVDAEFVTRHHDDPGPVCALPVPPLRTPSPLPVASSGVSDYRARRKVEVVPAGATSTTAPCPPGAAQFRALSSAEGTTLTAAIDLAVTWMDTAIAELTPGDPEGDAGLTAYFGGTGLLTTVEANLVSWRDHLDTVVRTNNRHGTQCNATCRTAIAFNQGSGAAAQMTVCPKFFRSLPIHTSLTQAQREAFVMLHEAGHGAIGTRDTGYGHKRLIEFLAGFPAIAENNTDSYTLMVLCLNGFPGFCSAPVTADTNAGMSAGEQINSRRGLGWLQTWLMWAQQDTSSLYGQMNTARVNGRGIRATNTYYAGVYDELVGAFNIHRPAGDPPPTFSEQTTVAAILDRVALMESAAAAGLTAEKDTSATPADRWAPGPGRSVMLTGGYFSLTTDRERVEYLLPLIIKANLRISTLLEPMYQTYIQENVINNRADKP